MNSNQKHNLKIVRRSELDLFLDAYRKIIKRQINNAFFLISGEKGIGKSTLMEQFQHDIKTREDIIYNPKLFIFYSCSLSDISNLYSSFIAIGKIIGNRTETKNIFIRFLRKILKDIYVLYFYDLLKALISPKISKKDAYDKDEFNKEKRKFQKFLKILVKGGKRNPWIISIENIQWMDDSSILILNECISTPEFRGIIILELGEKVENRSIKFKQELERLQSFSNIEKCPLIGFSKECEKEIIEDRYGKNFFTEEELLKIYNITGGNPSILKEKIGEWEKKGLVKQLGGNWYKEPNFFSEALRTPHEKFREACAHVLLDGKITQKEKKLLDDLRISLGLGENEAEGILVDVMIEKGIKKPNSKFMKTEQVSPRPNSIIVRDIFSDEEKILKKLDIQNKEIVDELKLNLNSLRWKIVHKNICQIDQIIIWEENYHLLMEYAGRKTLCDWVREKGSESIGINEFLIFAKQIAYAMSKAHHNEIFHGELRPDHIFITDNLTIKIFGFELSHIRKCIRKCDKKIQDILYQPPERVVSGLDHSLPSKKTDIYSFGIILYELISCEYPFKHSNNYEKAVELIIQNDVPDLKSMCKAKGLDVHPELAKIIQKCICEEANRFENFDSILLELERLTSIPPPPPPPPTWIKALSFGIILVSIMYLICAWFFEIWPFTPPVQYKNYIVINQFQNKIDGDDRQRYNDLGVEIEYLLQRNLKQFMIPVFNSKTFEALRMNSFKSSGSEPEPILEITGEMVKGEGDEEIKLSVTQRYKRNHVEKIYTFGDEISLLVESKKYPIPIIDDITEHCYELLKNGGTITNTAAGLDNFVPLSRHLTDNWDAFSEFYKGEKLWNKLDVDAQSSYINSVFKDQDFALALLRLYEVNIFDGKPEIAEEYLRKIDFNKRKLCYFDSIMVEAKKFHIKYRYPEEQKILRQLRNDYPSDKEINFNLAEAYYQAAETELAINFFEIVYKLDPDFPLLYNHFGYCLAFKGDSAGAISTIKKYVELDSTANAYDSYGDCAALIGDYNTAIEMKKKGIEKNDSLNYLYSSLAYIHMSKFELKDAKDGILKYMEKSKERRDFATAKFMLGYIHFINKEYHPAIDCCEAGLNLMQSTELINYIPELSWLKSLCSLELGDSQVISTTIDEFENLIEDNDLSSNNYHPILKFYYHLKLIKALRKKDISGVNDAIEKFQEAKYKLSRGTQIFSLPFFMFECAKAKYKLECCKEDANFEEAKKLINEWVLPYNKNIAFSHYYFGKIYQSQDSTELAREHYKKFINLTAKADFPIGERMEVIIDILSH